MSARAPVVAIAVSLLGLVASGASAQYFGGDKVQYPFDRPEKGWLFEFHIKPGF